jgi:hypothetical protein
MEKAKYEKPIALDLSGRAAAGQKPLACITGNGVVAITCFDGGNDAACYTGTVGLPVPEDCRPGTSPDGATCVPGTSASAYECAGGSGPLYPGSCTAGPSHF